MAFGLIIAILRFILSPWGIFGLLLGLLAFIILPIIPRVSNRFHGLAGLHGWLAGWLLRRFAFVHTNQNDLLIKSLEPTGRGFEKISLDGEERELSDPAARKHYWLGSQFALVDGETGVMFDPRDAAHGNRKRRFEEQGTYRVPATTEQWTQYSIQEWVRGVWEFPAGVNELVDLSGIRQVIDGGEKADYPKRIEELYKHHRNPTGGGPPTSQMLLLLAALILPFAALWMIASQGPSGGSTVSYGSVALLAAAGVKAADVDTRTAATAAALVLPALAGFALIWATAGALFAILLVVMGIIGFVTPLFLAIISRPLDRLAGGYGKQLLSLYLLSYERPVLEWSGRKYRVRDQRELDVGDDPTYYGLGYSLLGLSFEPEPSSWGAMVVDTDDVANKTLADGGETASNIPATYQPVPDAPELVRGDRGGFVPKKFDDDCYYIHSGISRGKYADSATGERVLKRLLWAKDKYGGGSGLDQRQMMIAMGVLGTVSFATGIGVFFL